MGRGWWGWWKFLVTEILFSQKHLPGVLKRRGGGGEATNFEVFFPYYIFFFQKCSWGSKTDANFFSGGGGGLGRPTPPPGGRAGSENDTLLPMTMTCDRLKFWSGPAWRSKVIIRKPWRRKNKK